MLPIRYVLFVVFVLGWSVDARADKKVDWSQYIEAPGTKTPVAPSVRQPDPTESKPAKATKAKAKKPAKLARAKRKK